ncbi:rCG63695 [Rattus norvegicus]|uniref:RCG63695 n=1 Tax=Rattus norvegicus TaxID=10116 RepID=A6HRP0_RAT|nr:rCG63695 [Rattus norvegicus]
MPKTSTEGKVDSSTNGFVKATCMSTCMRVKLVRYLWIYINRLQLDQKH